MTLWVGCKPVTCLTGLRVAEHQLTKMTVRTTYNLYNVGKVAKVLEVICENRKQMIHVICNGTVIRDMPAHFVARTQHEVDCCKIRAKAAD